MIYEILKDFSMGEDFETDWLPVNGLELSRQGKGKSLASVQIVWQNVSGNYDGILEAYISNDGEYKCFGKRINVNSESNGDDARIIIMNLPFRFLKLVYLKRGISGGVLNITANFS